MNAEHPLFNYDDKEAERRDRLKVMHPEPGMGCPRCKTGHTRVTDSRGYAEPLRIRRRRECESCALRFTTYEHIGTAGLPDERAVHREARRIVIRLLAQIGFADRQSSDSSTTDEEPKAELKEEVVT